VEQLNLAVRMSERVRKLDERYSPPYFHYTCVLSTTKNDPKSVKELVDLTKGKLWKEAMVEEM